MDTARAVAMVLVAVPSGLYGAVVGIDTTFFVLVCATLATDHVVGNAIGEPAGAVLFQPMPVERRMRTRLAVDGWLGSVALVGAGFLLLGFRAADLATVAPYLFAVAAIAAVGVLVALLQYHDYVGALRKTLQKYRDTPMSLADACIVRMSEIYARHAVLTLDSDFLIYRRHGRDPLAVIHPADQ